MSKTIILFLSLVILSLEQNANPTIYLASDSTVREYADQVFIGGWGMYLPYFLKDNVKVSNAANGGRSSRSFINEGRLYDIGDCTVKFTQNNGKSIGSVIKPGDYLFVEFAHNDDCTSLPAMYIKIYDRCVETGEPDENGIYPTEEAVKVSNSEIPQEFLDLATDAEKKSAYEVTKSYGASYYGYKSGTYKWYIKQYIDLARSKGAIPVVVTPVSRKVFKDDGTINSGKGLFGENFAFVEAARQIAKEEDCLLLDLHKLTMEMLETATPDFADFFMALKPNELKGNWPNDYDADYLNEAKGFTAVDSTHYNKYGAYLCAAFIADSILEAKGEKHNGDKESFTFVDSILTSPKKHIDPSGKLSKDALQKVKELFKNVNPII